MAIEALHSVKSDIGLKRRHNEDCFVASPELGLYVVCDGMGGSQGGEIASRLAVDTIFARMRAVVHDHATEQREPYAPDFSPATNRLADAIRSANKAIQQLSLEAPTCAGMGTTVVAALIWDGCLSVAHVGDSRLYLIRNGIIQPLTTDHSWVAEQIANGSMTEEEGKQSSRKNLLTRALGVESTVDVDLNEISLVNGDLLLLCSDGLTRGVPSEAILQVLKDTDDLDNKADRLVSLANQAGGDDNITVVLVALRRRTISSIWSYWRQQWSLEPS